MLHVCKRNAKGKEDNMELEQVSIHKLSNQNNCFHISVIFFMLNPDHIILNLMEYSVFVFQVVSY